MGRGLMSRYTRNARKQVEEIMNAGNCACPPSHAGLHDEKGCHGVVTRFKCATTRYQKGGHDGHTDEEGHMSCIYTLQCRCKFNPGKAQAPRYAVLDSEKEQKEAAKQ